MYVAVEGLDPDIEKDGLNKSSIQTDVELKLRIAGIKVLTEEEVKKEPGMPWLYVQVYSVKGLGFHAISIVLELNQGVYLSRDLKIGCVAATWSTRYVGYAGAGTVNRLRDNVKDKVDEFINDYLEMNPKE